MRANWTALRILPIRSCGYWTGLRKEGKWENWEDRESKKSLHGNIRYRNCSLLIEKHFMLADLLLRVWRGVVLNGWPNDLPVSKASIRVVRLLIN
jgi:hypothetical protein